MAFKVRGTLGIDLGTTTVLIYKKRKGIVIKEPSIVAVEASNKNKIVAAGIEAMKLLQKSQGNILGIRPFKNGIISNFDMTEKMLKYFIIKARGNKFNLYPDLIISISAKASDVERRALKSAAKNAGAKKVFLVQEPLVAAIGSGLDIRCSAGQMLVDIGGGTTDIAVISLGGIVLNKSIAIAGDSLNNAIDTLLKEKYSLIAEDNSIEGLKLKLATIDLKDMDMAQEVRGRDLKTGIPKIEIIRAKDLMEIITPLITQITDAISDVIKQTPPELIVDIAKNGICLTGGGSLLKGLDKHIEKTINIKAYVSKNAIHCVAEGLGKIFNITKKSEENFLVDQLYFDK